MKFSEREGITKARTEIQLKSMDSPLRNKLWNVLDVYYWSKANYYARGNVGKIGPNMRSRLNKLYNSHLKLPVDTISSNWSKTYQHIRELFFSFDWCEVYNFMEFMSNASNDVELNKKFQKTCNNVLESEVSAYRFVGKEIARITSEIEIESIEEALQSPFSNVNAHLENALKLMSDKKSPDYINSIKESISAIEAICRIIVGKKTTTLGKALKKIEQKGIIELSPALKQAFDKLYGYTCSSDGIRHAFSDEKIKTDFEEAKFMLVSCSGFVNYLKIKISKAGLENR